MVKFLFQKVTKSDSISATSNERILQRVTSEFLQRATSARSNEQILQQVTSDFLQRTTSATSNERILQRVKSDFLQRATSATSNERILQRVTSNEWISRSNEKRVKSYASWRCIRRNALMLTFMNKCFLKSLRQRETQVSFFWEIKLGQLNFH